MDNPKPSISYSPAALQISQGLRTIADSAVRNGIPIDVVASAFQAVTTGLTHTVNTVLIQAGANAIMPATPADVPDLKLRRNGQ